MKPNWKLLLKKYILHIEDCEGIDFLDEKSEYLTEEEREIIKKMKESG